MNMRKYYAEAEYWDGRYSRASIRALERFHDPSDLGCVIEEFMSKKSRGAFRATNPFSKQLWLKALVDSFITKQARTRRKRRRPIMLLINLPNDDTTCSLVTFTHRDWVFADTNIEFALKAAKQKVRNVLKGLSHISAFDVAYYTNEQWRTGNQLGHLVSFHCHSLVWFRNESHLSRVRIEAKKQFVPVLGNESGARFDLLESTSDALNVLRYQAKMPIYGKKTSKNGPKTKQFPSYIKHKRRHLLLRYLSQYTTFDFWFGSGDGAEILREARAAVLDERNIYKYKSNKEMLRTRRRTTADFPMARSNERWD